MNELIHFTLLQLKLFTNWICVIEVQEIPYEYDTRSYRFNYYLNELVHLPIDQQRVIKHSSIASTIIYRKSIGVHISMSW